MAEGEKRVVTLELDADVLAQAEAMGPDLAGTVTRALRRYFPRQMTDEELARYIEAANARYEKHGLAGEEYMPV